MKEYVIYIKCKGGTPYLIHFFNNITDAKLKLYDMISLEEERGRPYFVDNDFFENKYSCNLNLKYFCIKEREISEFKTYSEEKTSELEKNKIIFLTNFKK